MYRVARKVASAAARAMNAPSQWVWVMALAVVGSLPSAVLAQAPPLIPDTGVDVGDYVTEAVTKLGTVLLVVVGAWFAFRVLRAGISWARRAF